MHHEVVCGRVAGVDAGILSRRLLLLAAPLALALLMLFHPSPYDDVAGELVPIAGWWTALHAVQFVLFALAGAAVWLLVGGLRGGAATVARLGAVVFVLFYDIGDAIAGVATGILAGGVASGALSERAAVEAVEALFADPTKNLFFQVGIYAWIAALAAAAVALWRAGSPRLPLLLLAPAAYFVTFDHARPFGSLAFACFFLAAAWLELAPKSDASPVAGRPRRAG